MEADKSQDPPGWQVGDPGELSEWCSSISKAGRLETQEELVFHVNLKVEGNQYPSLKAVRQKEFSLYLFAAHSCVLSCLLVGKHLEVRDSLSYLLAYHP